VNGRDAVEVNGATVTEALSELTESHPELRKHLFTTEGKLRAFVNLYLNDEDVRYLPAKEATAVSAADTLSIIPSIAGGLPGLAVQAIALARTEIHAMRTLNQEL
jgi:molybdopterin converting factor small subunit